MVLMYVHFAMHDLWGTYLTPRREWGISTLFMALLFAEGLKKSWMFEPYDRRLRSQRLASQNLLS